MLIGGLADQPEAALPHARELVKIDPFNEVARATLLRSLLVLGRQTEAERHFEQAMRVFKDLGRDAEFNLQRTWRKLREKPGEIAGASEAAHAVTVAATPPSSPATAKEANRLIGRESEWSRLSALLDEMSGESVVLVSGEPGLGKSRLLAELIAHARRRGIATFAGQSFETSHPYAPWIEAIGALPAPAAADNGNAGQNALASRERLFAAVAERVLGQPALLVFDDVQWCDEVSADLLQHVARAARGRPLLLVLAARGGELPDNGPVHLMLRSLRQAQRLREIKLSALSPRDIATLVQAAAPAADADLIAQHSGGNPLYALELSLAGSGRDIAGSLKQLVRDRIERLPAIAAEALTWASVLGPAFSLDHLTRIVPLPPEQLTGALELIERHELLRLTNADPARCAYRFAHDLVHRAVYTALSEPRRRLMHLKAARALQELGASDETIAAVVAHHAALGGDAGMASAACVAAGRRCLRLFANAGAETLARRGLHYAATLPEPAHSQRMLELIQVETQARRPADLKQAIAHIEALAERALDQGSLEHARLGYHMLSHLRWEGGSWADAQRDTLRAEFVSRSGDEKQQVHAMAEAARCLAMLERDLAQAETLALEARARGAAAARRTQRDLRRARPAAAEPGRDRGSRGPVPARARRRAPRRRARQRIPRARASDRTGNTMPPLSRRPKQYCDELVALSERLRDGSEVPCARARCGRSAGWRATIRMRRVNSPVRPRPCARRMRSTASALR